MKFQKISTLESTQFLQIWPFFVGIGLTQIFFEYILGQPNSYKVNPIPTKSTQFLQTSYIGKSTQFLQMGQPNSYNRSQPNSDFPYKRLLLPLAKRYAIIRYI